MVPGDPCASPSCCASCWNTWGTRSQAPVTVSMRADDKHFQIGMHGDATVDSEQVPVLFEQPESDPFDHGLGLRLLVARAIAEAHNGTLVANVGGRAARLPLRASVACRLTAAGAAIA